MSFKKEKRSKYWFNAYEGNRKRLKPSGEGGPLYLAFSGRGGAGFLLAGESNIMLNGLRGDEVRSQKKNAIRNTYPGWALLAPRNVEYKEGFVKKLEQIVIRGRRRRSAGEREGYK